MKSFRYGMTLFELLIVMIVVGIVYSVGLFTLKKEKISSATITISAIKRTLLALEHSGEIRMVCDKSCQECRIWDSRNTLLSTLHLQSERRPIRYGFDRFGELKALGNIVTKTGGVLRQGCFEVTLNNDGTLSPLILKSNLTFYAYTPLGGEKPFVTQNEDALRRFLFNETYTPIRSDSYYGAH